MITQVDFLEPKAEIHGYGAFAHGVLSAFHSLGAVYNFRRKNWLWAGFHLLALTFSLVSARRHLSQ